MVSNLTKSELKAEIARLKGLGFVPNSRVDEDAFVKLVKRLEGMRCNTALAIKIAEYEQNVAYTAYEAEWAYYDCEGLEVDENLDFTIGGITGTEDEVTEAVLDALIRCEVEVRDAHEAFHAAMDNAYENLLVLWHDEEDDVAVGGADLITKEEMKCTKCGCGNCDALRNHLISNLLEDGVDEASALEIAGELMEELG